MLPSFSNPFSGSDLSGHTHMSIADELGEGIAFQYNPTSFSISRSVEWIDVKSFNKGHGTLQFMGGGSDTCEFTILVDDSDTTGVDVLEAAKYFHGLAMPYVSPETDYERPPALTITWDKVTFTGVAESVSVSFLMFDAAGKPIRCEVSMTLKGRAFEALDAKKFYKPPAKAKAPKSPSGTEAASSTGFLSGL